MRAFMLGVAVPRINAAPSSFGSSCSTFAPLASRSALSSYICFLRVVMRANMSAIVFDFSLMLRTLVQRALSCKPVMNALITRARIATSASLPPVAVPFAFRKRSQACIWLPLMHSSSASDNDIKLVIAVCGSTFTVTSKSFQCLARSTFTVRTVSAVAPMRAATLVCSSFPLSLRWKWLLPSA